MSHEFADPNRLLTDDDVVQYLSKHTDFFVRHPSLLVDLALPHQTGHAVSLVERQVGMLRERNNDMQQRLQSLIDNARRNDILFEKTKRLTLSLLEATDINDLIDALLYSFDNDFEIEFTSLILFSESLSTAIPSRKDKVQVLPLESTQAILGTIITNNKTICGQLGHKEHTLIFQETVVGSTAIAPLTSGQPFGVLAIGNSDENYYRSSMSTLFLTHIADVLTRTIPQYLTHR